MRMTLIAPAEICQWRKDTCRNCFSAAWRISFRWTGHHCRI